MLVPANFATFSCNVALFPNSLQGREDASSRLSFPPRLILGTCSVACRSSSLLICNHRRPPLQLLSDCTWFPEHAGLPHGVEKRVYHYIGGWNLRAYIAYIIGIIPNFYSFLNNMGVSAPIGVTRFSYFAYWVGLFVSGAVFWVSCKISPPDTMYYSSG